MKKIKNILPHFVFILSVILHFLVSRSSREANIAGMISLLITPPYLFWIILHYSRPGKVMKYRIIVLTSAGFLFYLLAVFSGLDKYYPLIFNKYIKIIRIVLGLSLIFSLIIMVIFSNKVQDDEYKNKLL